MPEENFSSDLISVKNDSQVPWKISDVIFAYVFIFAFLIFATGILFLFNVDVNTSLFPAILQIILSFTTLSMIYLIVTQKYHISFLKAFGISVNKIPTHFIQGVMISFILILSTTLVSYMFLQFAGIPKQNPYVNVPAEKLRMISFLAVFLAPFVEELFFRGFMQPTLVKSLGAFGGIFVTALIFGFSHAQYFDYSVALAAVTVIGLVLGVTRYYTGSIMPGIFAHLLNNLFAALSMR